MANQPLMKVKMPDGSWKTMGGTNLNAMYGQIQADWNQNDPSAADYIKNRSHYSGAQNEITHLDKKYTILRRDISTYHDQENNVSTLSDNPKGELQVVFNDTIYSCDLNNLIFLEEFESYCYCIGNLSLIGVGEDNGMPFAIIVKQYNDSYEVITEEPTTINFAVNMIFDGEEDEYSIIPLDTIETEAIEIWSVEPVWNFDSLINSVNKKYTVIIDGEEHEMVSGYIDGTFYLGDYKTLMIMRDPSSMKTPVVIIDDPRQRKCGVLFKESGNHTLTVKAMEDVEIIASPKEVKDFNVSQLPIFSNPEMPAYLYSCNLEDISVDCAPPIIEYDDIEYKTIFLEMEQGAGLIAAAANAETENAIMGIDLDTPFFGVVGLGEDILIPVVTKVKIKIDKKEANNQITPILAEGLYDLKLNMESGMMYSSDLMDFVLEPDAQYVVYWNDNEYHCGGELIEEGVVVLGNSNPMAGKAPKPFSIAYSPEQGKTNIFDLPQDYDTVVHSIKISNYNSSLHPFDGKYLPIPTETSRGGVKALPAGAVEGDNYSPAMVDEDGMIFTVSLPEVYSKDEGKALVVKDGRWAVGDTIGGSDWDINNPDQPGFVANRTHFVDGEIKYINFPEDISTCTTGTYEGKVFYKVSNDTPSADELTQFIALNCDLGNGSIIDYFGVMPADSLEPMRQYQTIGTDSFITFENNILCARQLIDGITETGIYFAQEFLEHTELKPVSFWYGANIEKLSPIFMPESYVPMGLMSSVMMSIFDEMEEMTKETTIAIETKITSPLTAEVGQMIVVKAVDENGKPTEWEAVNVPSAPVTSVNGLTGEVQLTIPEVKEYTVNGISADESGNITIDIPVVKDITVNNIAADENGNITIDIPEVFSGNYNDLTNKPVAAAVADISGETVAVADFNALLAALRAAGLMATE